MLILLRRVFVTDLDVSTTQWREYLFNTLDPDGPILQNLVINSTAFELTDGILIWTNPATNDEYRYDSPNAVTKTTGTPPDPIPDPPDLTDPYGLRYVHEFRDINNTVCKFEIYERAYAGASEEVEAAGDNLTLTYENEGKIFTSFRGSRASVTLSSRTSRKFYELFEKDEREHYGRILIGGVVKWTGWNVPDIFTEAWGNPPFQTNLNFTDGIGGLKNLIFPDVNANGYTGTISEKDAIIAALNRIGLRLNVNIACNIREERMDTGSQPIEQSLINVEAFVTFSQGERTAISCYDALDKILRSWNAVLFQEGNEWWIVREPELYSSPLVYKKFDPDGAAISTSSLTLPKTFASEGILLHGATLETKPAFTNVAVAQKYGELLVQNGNFAVNGKFEDWTAYIIGGYQQGWKLDKWTYDKLEVFPFTNPTSLGRVRRVTESTGLNQSNNYINIYEVVRSFTDPVGRMSSEPFPVKQELGNRLQVTFKVRCNTKGSDNRLVEAYFNIAVKVGTQWLAVNGTTGAFEWTATETRLRWKVAEVMRWETIALPAMEIPEDGNVIVYLYQMVQVGSVSKVEYVADFDDLEIKLVDNPALQNERLYYKTANPEVYTSNLEELEIELGDVATIMSQNAKIIDGEPSSLWTRPGESEGQPLAKLICRELANQYQRTIYRLRGGRTNQLTNSLSFLATYEDTVNEAGRLFILTGGEWIIKDRTWTPDLVEINQEETTVDIRVVAEPRSGTSSNTGANSGAGPEGTGSTEPNPPAAPVDLGDEDDIIPIIKDGSFADSGITASRDGSGIINGYEFPHRVKGPDGVDPEDFVTKAQLDAGGGGGGTDANAVHYNAADGKNKSEKRQARTNIGTTDSAPQTIATAGTIANLAYTSNLLIFTGNNVTLQGLQSGQIGEEVALYNATNADLTIPFNMAGTAGDNFVFSTSIPRGCLLTVKRLNVGLFDGWYPFQSDVFFNIQGAWTSINRTLRATRIFAGLDPTTAAWHIFKPADASAAPILRLQDFSNVVQFEFGLAGTLQARNRAWIGIPIGTSPGTSAYSFIRSFDNTAPPLIVQTATPDNIAVFNIDRTITQGARSSAFDRLTRRDETLLLYPITVTTAGTVNDLPETAGNFNYYLTACTRLNGMAGGENGKERVIQNDNTVDMVIGHQDAGSIAANRFNLIGAVNLTVPAGGIVTFTYKSGISRWVLKSRNF
jgi:hypothetical protein